MSVYWKRAADGSKLWYIRFKDPNGIWRQKAAGRFKRVADALDAKIQMEIASGTFGIGDVLFENFSKRWLETYASVHVKPSTLKDYQGVVNRHLNPCFGESLINNIKPGMIDGFMALKIQDGLAPRTVNKCLTVLKMILKRAVYWGELKENPAQLTEKAREVHKEMAYLNPEEVKAFLAAATPGFRPLFETAVSTGIRQGELLALRRADVDFKAGKITVTRSYHPDYGFTEPKSAYSVRSVIMIKGLPEILRACLDSRPGNPGDLLFPNRKGKPMSHQNLVTRQFHPTLERAGVKRIRFHDLRHTYAALMISIENVNVKVLQHQMGHASINITMDRYGHLLPEATDGLGDELGPTILI